MLRLASSRTVRTVSGLVLAAWLSFSAPFGHALPSSPSDLSAAGRPSLRIFTDRDGLPQNAILSTAFDSIGYLWVGTKDGVARYNGRTWTIIDLTPIAGSNYIQAICTGSDGSMWFGTNGGGLARLHEGNWSTVSMRDGLPSNDVTSLAEAVSADGSAVLWIGTSAGISFVGADGVVRSSLVEQSGRRITGLYAANLRGEVWAMIEGVGAARFKSGVWRIFGESDGLPRSFHTTALDTGALGDARCIVVGAGAGLFVFDGERFSRYVAEGVPEIRQRGFATLREVTGSDGTLELWAGNADSIQRFAAGRCTRWPMSRWMTQCGVWNILEETSEGRTTAIWFGTSGRGLVRWELGRWTNYGATRVGESESIYSFVETVSESGDRAVLVGTSSGRVYQIGEDLKLLYGDENPHLGGAVSALLETADEKGGRVLWIGTRGRGLHVKRSGSWTIHSNGPVSYTREDGQVVVRNVQPLVSGGVAAITEVTTHDDRRDVLVGTQGGITRFVNGRTPVTATEFELPDPRVTCIVQVDSDIWIGTEQGLARYGAGGRTVYDAGSGLPNNVIMCVSPVTTSSGRREVWVGTRGGGIARILQTVSGETVAPTEGFLPEIPNQTIYRILQDRRGHIYAFTNHGVCRFSPRQPTPDNPTEYSLYVSTIEDGLPSNECNTGASMIDSRGRVWAGTIAGAAVFDPEQANEAAPSLPLRIEQATIADGTALAGGDSVSYNLANVGFEFALLSFFKPAATDYRWQLVGFDVRPTEWSPDWKVSYTNLPAGDYVIRVWGRDAKGAESGPIEVPFTVLSPPWRTWWAYAVYAIVTVLAVTAAIRIRERNLRSRTALLEGQVEERTAELRQKVEQLDASERAAHASEQRAVEASLAKSTFLANMSHELRTPLNAILGFGQLLARDSRLAREHRDDLEVITRSGDHLLGLINDVLSIAKIEAGQIALTVQPFNLRRMIADVVEMIVVRARGKGLILRCEIDPGVPSVVEGDETKLRQVLINLLGNAVKFTDRGHITLGAVWSDGRARFTVADTGHGIAPAEMAMLFEPFSQTASGRKAQEGTGLGLVISRNFVRLMGGDMTVESRIDEGTTFRFEADLPEATRPVHAPSSGRVLGLAPGTLPLRVLVADDGVHNRALLRRTLGDAGFEIREASNGAEAVARWEDWRPDAILMDMRMPDVDGLEATRRIRSREAAEGAERPTRIIALTASAFDHDRQTFAEAGCDQFLGKPFSVEALFDVLGELLGVEYVTAEVSAAEAIGDRISIERLKGIPAALREELSQSLGIGDIQATLSVIERIHELDAPLADELRRMVRAFRLEEIFEALPSG